MHDEHTATLVRELDAEYADAQVLRSCELAERENNGIRVRLMFDPVSEIHPVYLIVNEGENAQLFPVPADCALDAFEHPFAYAP